MARKLSMTWTGRLDHYRTHRNDEHVCALFDETIRYVGLHLELDLCRSKFWSERPLWRTASALLFLVDRGVVERSRRHGRRTFEPLPHAESWIAAQAPLRPYFQPLSELIAALRHELSRRAHFHRYR
jgi:hypothetical protein